MSVIDLTGRVAVLIGRKLTGDAAIAGWLPESTLEETYEISILLS